MAQSSWPSPDTSRVVNDSQYERLALGYGPVAGLIGDPSLTALCFGDSTGMQVKIRADRYATIRGYQWYSGATDFTKAISANASGSTRIDLVVLRLTRSTWNVTIEVVNGTPGSGVAPALTQNTGSTGVYELPIGVVTVTNGAATITAGNVVPIGLYLASDGSGYTISSANASRSTLLGYIPAVFTGQQVADINEWQIYTYTGSTWHSKLPDVQKFTASGTWTRPAYAKWVRFRGRGCGGAGGSTTAPSAGQSSKGGGGGEGGYSETVLAGNAVTSTVAITIGTAGAPSAGNPGGAGGNVSAGAYMVANGGGGGPRASASAASFGISGGAGGAAGTGDLTLAGTPGGSGFSDAGLGMSGCGGGGGGGVGKDFSASTQVTAGANGVDGGGGGGALSCGAVAAALGGSGGPGWIVVETYF